MLVAESSEERCRLYLRFRLLNSFHPDHDVFFFKGGKDCFLLQLLFITKLRGAINFLDDKNLFKFDITRAERGYLTNLGWNALRRREFSHRLNFRNTSVILLFFTRLFFLLSFFHPSFFTLRYEFICFRNSWRLDIFCLNGNLIFLPSVIHEIRDYSQVFSLDPFVVLFYPKWIQLQSSCGILVS